MVVCIYVEGIRFPAMAFKQIYCISGTHTVINGLFYSTLQPVAKTYAIFQISTATFVLKRQIISFVLK